jgi:hypothetical protein
MTELLAIMNKVTSGTKTFGYEDADRLGYAIDVSGGIDAVSPLKLLSEQIEKVKQAAYADWVSFFGRLMDLQSQLILDNSGAFATLDDAGLYAPLVRFKAFLTYTLQVASQEATDAAKVAAQQAADATEAVRSSFDTRALAEASEHEAALLAHLSEHASYYRYALWQVLTPSAQMSYIGSLVPLGLIEPRTIGVVGDRLAVPVIHEYEPKLKIFLEGVLTGLGEIKPLTDTIILPTPAVTMESRLGACDGCEAYIMKQRELDLQQKTAEVKAVEERAKQEAAETERYQKRLQQNPPVLDDPDPSQAANRILLSIRQEKES